MYETKLSGTVTHWSGRKFSNTLKRAIKDSIIGAGREFALTLIEHTPVWTGQAQASLMPLIWGLGIKVPLPIPVASESAAARFKVQANRVSEGLSKGHYEAPNWQSDEVHFGFSTDVEYFSMMDTYGVPGHWVTPPPWGGFAAAEQVFHSSFDEFMTINVQRVTGFIKTVSVDTRGSIEQRANEEGFGLLGFSDFSGTNSTELGSSNIPF
jgi:hypothetical protein